MTVVSLAAGLRAQLQSEARAAFPRECCGLIEGHRFSNAPEILRLHPLKNLSAEPDKFEIDPADHIRLLKAARSRNADIIGCYHSHPNGKPEPSDTDRAHGGEDNFLWLILSLADGCGPVTIAPFIFREGKFEPVPLGG